MRNFHCFADLLKCLALVCLLLSSNEIVWGQTLNKKLPSVYLSFNGYLNDSKGMGMARMALHNNTKWPIILTRRMGSVLDGNVPLAYTIELATGCYDPLLAVDVISRIKLMPGKTINFIVPINEFSQGSKIYVEFAFSWEKQEEEYSNLYEPIHRVYFYVRDLPSRNKK